MSHYDLWGRLTYVLSPQFDIYEKISRTVRGNVADLGSGTGFGTHMFARNADMVVGYEIDDSALAFSNRVFANRKLRFLKSDVTQNFNFEGLFDYVTMIDVIEHIVEDELAVSNAKRLLADEGVFFCSTPNRLCRYRMSRYHVREYTPQELDALLSGVFGSVEIVDMNLKPIETPHTTPLIARCRK